MEDKARKEMQRRINLSYKERREKIEREYGDKLKYLDDERKSFTRLNLDNLVKRAELVLKEPNNRVPEGYSPLEDVFLESYGFLESRATGKIILEGGELNDVAEEFPEYAYYSTEKGHEFYKKAFRRAKMIGAMGEIYDGNENNRGLENLLKKLRNCLFKLPSSVEDKTMRRDTKKYNGGTSQISKSYNNEMEDPTEDIIYFNFMEDD